jgi:aarF domain-containing kinase
MVYGKQGIFDADRLIDLLNAFESFTVASQSSRGDMDQQLLAEEQASARRQAAAAAASSSVGGASTNGVGIFGPGQLIPQLSLPLPAGAAFGDGASMAQAAASGVGLFGLPANRFDLRQQITLDSQGRLREALRRVGRYVECLSPWDAGVCLRGGSWVTRR